MADVQQTSGAYAKVRHDGGEDDVAIEEPLEIRVDGEPLAVTMRTPGQDEELSLETVHKRRRKAAAAAAAASSNVIAEEDDQPEEEEQ